MSGEELPEGWAETTLGGCGKWTGGGTPSKGEESYWTDGTVPWVSPKDMKADDIYKAEDLITEAAVRASATSLIAKDSVLLVTRSGILQRTVPVAINRVPVTMNQDMKALTPHPGISSDFLAQFVRSREKDILAECAKAGTTVASLEFERLKAFPVALPPHPEQKRIVARLDALQARSRAAREALAEVPALLETFRQSVLAAAFRGDLTAEWRAKNPNVEPASKLLERIRAERKRRWEKAHPKKTYVEPEPVDDSDLPELPEGWCWTTIETVGDIVNGRQRAAPVPGQKSTPYLRIANVQDDYIDFSDLNHMDHDPAAEIAYRVRPGDILVSGGQSLQKVGQSALFEVGMPSVGFQKNLFRFRGSESLPDPRFAQLVFRAWVLNGTFRQRASITTNLAYMTTTNFAQCPFPLPPAAEQCAVVTLAGSALHGVEKAAGPCEVLMADLETLDQSILARAFRGELVDQDPNDEPAAALLARLRQDGGTPPSNRRRAK